MQKFIEHRIGDTRLVRLLLKWLHAGVMEDGKLEVVEEGTPQGGIISPLLANIYLHYALEDCKRDGRSKLETFDFLGFTHIEGRTRAGKPTLLRRTSRKKRKAKLATLLPEIRKRRHRPVREQQRWLSSVLLGHSFFRTVENQWHRSLQRRSQRGRWSVEERRRFRQHRPLPAPTICHPWPEKRFALR